MPTSPCVSKNRRYADESFFRFCTHQAYSVTLYNNSQHFARLKRRGKTWLVTKDIATMALCRKSDLAGTRKKGRRLAAALWGEGDISMYPFRIRTVAFTFLVKNANFRRLYLTDPASQSRISQHSSMLSGTGPPPGYGGCVGFLWGSRFFPNRPLF